MSEAIWEEVTNSFVGDSIEVMERDGHFDFTIDNPWAGSTETGFGYQTHAGLTLEQARSLRDWLSARIALYEKVA